MAKGKYRSTAEAREVRETAIAEAARLRKDVERLTDEVARLDRENLEQRAADQATVARLRGLIAANTSEALDQMRTDLAEVKALLETTETARKVIAEGFMRLADALQDAFEDQGMKPVDAHERKMKIARVYPSHINDTAPGFVMTDDLNATLGDVRLRIAGKSDTKDPAEIARLHRLQRAKGLRA